MARQLLDMVQVNVYHVADDEKLPFKVSDNKPVLKFYPNERTENDKIDGAK